MREREAPVRCAWVNERAPLSVKYHDKEWGVPVHSDRLHFQFLVLEGAQAGLNWTIILNKREGYRKAFSDFDPEKVAKYEAKQVDRLMRDSGIIRNRAKIKSAIDNAKAFLKVQQEFGSFEAYVWPFVGGHPKQNRWKTTKQIPASTHESDALSKDLKSRGFSFVGSTTIYAHMQAAGMVNDHTINCFRYSEIRRLGRR